MAKYCSLNSNILLSEKTFISPENRGLLFGDSFNFEIRGNSSKAFFENEYFDFFIYCIKKIRFERSILHRKSSLVTDLELLLQKNRIYKGFKARIIVFRNDLETNSCSILMSVDSVENEYYPELLKGFKVSVYKDYIIPESSFDFDLTPRFSEVFLAQQKLKSEGLDDFLLCDKNGNIIKSLYSSVFFVKNENLILPNRFINNSSKIFVNIVVELAKSLNIPVVNWDVKEKDLYDLDEVFLGNIVDGFNRVMAFRNKRYFYKTVEILLEELNRELKIK
ncbi:MAG: hypothetical protein GX793_04210 [Bacteroidales bacterium]|jgi:branched-chain amino acid aminotransferase|nr:aminotransferase class IV [Bacteroidales bacterium]MCK9499567.1 aminotransferase class IV [Bacteroidales bacterium]MDY0315523.1 aminotransferase class IV [Bacteroidales bacterium]NLB86248.1 hypothetical protein [Bacteroidales bacterium]